MNLLFLHKYHMLHIELQYIQVGKYNYYFLLYNYLDYWSIQRFNLLNCVSSNILMQHWLYLNQDILPLINSYIFHIIVQLLNYRIQEGNQDKFPELQIILNLPNRLTLLFLRLDYMSYDILLFKHFDLISEFLSYWKLFLFLKFI